jgi:hypothetical protein
MWAGRFKPRPMQPVMTSAAYSCVYNGSEAIMKVEMLGSKWISRGNSLDSKVLVEVKVWSIGRSLLGSDLEADARLEFDGF